MFLGTCAVISCFQCLHISNSKIIGSPYRSGNLSEEEALASDEVLESIELLLRHLLHLKNPYFSLGSTKTLIYFSFITLIDWPMCA